MLTIAIIYLAISLALTYSVAHASVVNFVNTHSHHVIFDDLGKLSTGVTYINVAIPLNLTSIETQIHLFDSYLQSIDSKLYPITNTTNPEHISIKNMQQKQLKLEHKT